MFFEHRIVKPDQDRLADFQGWGSKVAGWAEHGSLGLITQAAKSLLLLLSLAA